MLEMGKSVKPVKRSMKCPSEVLLLGMLGNAEALYCGMPLDMRDPVCSNALISGYLKMDRLEEAVRIFEGMVQTDVVAWSSMVDGYCKKGLVCEARELFRVMPERNVFTRTAMIDGYMKIGSFDGFELLLQMRREGRVEVVSNLKLAEDRVDMKKGVRLGYVDGACKLFQIMDIKDVVSWNSIIAGYVQAQKIDELIDISKKCYRKTFVSWTTLITGFSSKGFTGKSVELFNLMPEKDDVAWTALISGFVTNGEYEEAIYWFIKMLQKAVKPNPLTLSIMISSSAGLATLNQGMQMHAHVVKLRMAFELSIQNSLVSMYSKCGTAGDAYSIFLSICAPNIVSYNSMITGFAQNGLGKEALDLFKKMLDLNFEPNEITFLGVLSACTHVGPVKEGWFDFRSMRSLYNIEQGPDHYACNVDLLDRAVLLDEAVNLINSMSFEPHSGIWGALLGASRTHIRLDLAKVAAQHISALEPNNATPYAVLSDFYFISGEKLFEEQVRMTKKSKGIKKSPGCSWIKIKDSVNLFLSGDQSHTNFE